MSSNRTKESVYFWLLRASGIMSLLILVVVLISLLIEGAPNISLHFLTGMWQTRNIQEGGIFPAIYGTLLLGVLVSVFSVPLGIACAVYLTEFGRGGRVPWLVKLAIRNLAGVPSVVYGLFGLALFVNYLQFGTSLLAASLTLTCMTLPWVISSSQEALKAVPPSYKLGSLALGASRWQTIRRVVLPNALSGMLTGSIIGVARAMGETAPIIIVGATFYMGYLPISPFEKFMALPYHIFILATQHSDPLAPSYAASTALVLIALVMLMMSGAIYLRYRLRSRKRQEDTL